MTPKGLGWTECSAALGIACALAFVGTCAVRGDQVETLNGDRYVGRVLSLGSDTLVVQSEVLGTLRLPRARISTITLEPRLADRATNANHHLATVPRSNNVAQASPTTSTNVASDFASAMRQLSGNSNVIQQVQEQFLAGAGPEAQAKFNDLVAGLLSGKMGVNDLRAEAKSALDQAKSARKDMGEEGGSMMDGYLAILDGFLKETEPAGVSTNSPVSTPKPKVQKPAEEE
jgi:hypothetical protein